MGQQLRTQLIALICGISAISCNGDNGGSGPPLNSDPLAYFGLISGRVITGRWGRYEVDAGREFVYRDGRTEPVTVTIEPMSRHGNYDVFPLRIDILPGSENSDRDFTLYLNADENGLYGYGLEICNVDVLFDEPVKVAPYPLSDGKTWTTGKGINSWPSRPWSTGDYDSCALDEPVAAHLSSTCVKTEDFTIGADVGYPRTYEEGFVVKHPPLFADETDHFYEVWIVPGVGIVRIASFEDTYADPKNGGEFYQFIDP